MGRLKCPYFQLRPLEGSFSFGVFLMFVVSVSAVVWFVVDVAAVAVAVAFFCVAIGCLAQDC